jgi:hypothetical protein
MAWGAMWQCARAVAEELGVAPEALPAEDIQTMEA